MWYHESNGRVYEVKDIHLSSMSEGEIHALQKISLRYLQDLNLGTSIIMPKGKLFYFLSKNYD